jgi:3-deoxy-D-manno-octulosonate 8-phosphate phosphatase (KDO 8-P phosphatase)
VIDPAVARRIRLLGLDVDGVLTDNAIFVGEVAGERVEFKRFDIQDGLAVGILRKAGIEVALVSGRWSRATELRASELRIDDVIQDSGARKAPAFGEMLERKGIGWDEVAFVGDDLADLPVFRRVGLPIAVANAVREVREAAAWVTTRPGGHGAVREVIEALLQARGQWEAGVRRYVEERDGAPA